MMQWNENGIEMGIGNWELEFTVDSVG